MAYDEAAPEPEGRINALGKCCQALIEHSAEAIALLGADGRFLYASPAVSRINGFPSEEFMGQNAFNIIHPDDLPVVLQHFQHLCAEPGAISTLQCRVQHRDGTWRWIEVIAHNLLNEPALQAVVLNYRDITECKQGDEAALHQAYTEVEKQVRERTAELTQANQALQESEEKFRTITEASRRDFRGAGWVLCFCQRCRHHVDRILARGTAPLTLRGTDSSGLSRPNGALCSKQRLAGRPAPGQYEMQFITRNGESRWGNFSPRVISFDGRPALMGIVIDISEQKHTEEALARSEANLRRAEHIAHLGHWEMNLLTGESFGSEESLRIIALQYRSRGHANRLLDDSSR